MHTLMNVVLFNEFGTSKNEEEEAVPEPRYIDNIRYFRKISKYHQSPLLALARDAKPGPNMKEKCKSD